jgi:[amino group carrier protein]-lysine/ornithine hydrolase
VAIPSFSQYERNAVQHLVDWMQHHGYDQAYRDEAGNAVGIRGYGERDIMLLGHIDTFSGFPDVKYDGRKLYGRGSVDAKGPLCTFAVAGALAKLPPNTRLIVVGAVEEEWFTSKGAHYIKDHFSPHFCVIGEPSNWDRITLGYKGRLIIEWQWYGELAHSAGQALSPAEHAFAYWQQVLDYTQGFNADKTRIFERLDATIQQLNTSQDGAYGRAEMTVGFRLPTSLTPQTVYEALAHYPNAKITSHGQEFAYLAEKDNALTRALRGAIRAENGTPSFVQKTGTADMNIVGRVWDCPIVAYGPGDSALDHTPHEHLDLDEYLRAIRVLKLALEKL